MEKREGTLKTSVWPAAGLKPDRLVEAFLLRARKTCGPRIIIIKHISIHTNPEPSSETHGETKNKKIAKKKEKKDTSHEKGAKKK